MKKQSLTKRELVMDIADQTGLVQQAVFAVLQLTLDGIIEALAAGRNVEFREFGVFEVATRKPRIGRNPRRPQDIVQIPKRKTVKFKPGKIMRERVR